MEKAVLRQQELLGVNKTKEFCIGGSGHTMSKESGPSVYSGVVAGLFEDLGFPCPFRIHLFTYHTG